MNTKITTTDRYGFAWDKVATELKLATIQARSELVAMAKADKAKATRRPAKLATLATIFLAIATYSATAKPVFVPATCHMEVTSPTGEHSKRTVMLVIEQPLVELDHLGMNFTSDQGDFTFARVPAHMVGAAGMKIESTTHNGLSFVGTFDLDQTLRLEFDKSGRNAGSMVGHCVDMFGHK